MAQLVYRTVDEGLKRAVRVAAASAGLSEKDWVVMTISAALKQGGGNSHRGPEPENVVAYTRPRKGRATGVVGKVSAAVEAPSSTVGSSPTIATRPEHDTSACRLYACGTCKVLGVKDAGRGLK
jgi:plasmid stability protein